MDPKLSANPDDNIINHLLANPKQIDLYYWNQNPNSRTIDYILEDPRNRLYRSFASKNSHDKMVDYLLENPIEISRFNFLENPNPKAVDYIFKRMAYTYRKFISFIEKSESKSERIFRKCN